MKKRILLRTLIPLTSVGVILGTALPLVSCSCGNNDDHPLSATTLHIDNTNFGEFLTGVAPNVTGYTPKFTDFLQNNNVNKINFDIDNVSISASAFNNCTVLSNLLQSIAIEFTSKTISIGRNSFIRCASISQIICSSTDAPTISLIDSAAFSECTNLTGFSREGQVGKITISSVGGSAFYGSKKLTISQINGGVDGVLDITGYTWTAGTSAHVSDSGYWLKSGGTFYNTGCLAVGSIECPFPSINGTYFTGCASLVEVTNLPNGPITTTFTDCVNLTTIEFKTGTTLGSIGSICFRNCASLSGIKLSTPGWTGGSDATNIASDAFQNCGLNGGTITGTGALDLLNAIRSRDASWLPGWIAA